MGKQPLFVLLRKIKTMAKKNITIDGTTVGIDKNGFISLTDIAKRRQDSEPRFIIRSWFKNSNTLQFLETWETLENANFKRDQMITFRMSMQDNSITPNIQNYINQTGATGIVSSSGRYGGTYAHSDIALNFCYWLSPKFQVYLMKEFQRLKADEQLRIGDPFNIKRFLATGSYSILVTSILSQMDERLLTHPQPYKSRLPFAAEADILNKIIFGQTAKQWRANNPDKPTDRNQRDYASILELTILNHLEFLDGMLFQWDVVEIKERETILQNTYDFIYPILKRSKTIKKLQDLADKM